MRALFLSIVTLLAFCPAGADMAGGRVLGPGGKPVAGAVVVVSNGVPFAKPAILKTDARGRFAYCSTSNQVTRVVVFRPGLAVAGGVLKPGMVFRLQPAGQAWGSVTDEKGNPVAGAVVTLGYVESGDQKGMVWIPQALVKYFRVRTTADGRWTISNVATSGAAHVFLDDPRFVRVDVESQLGPEAVAAPPLIARPGAGFEGKAVLENGKPAAGIYVFAQGVGDTPGWSLSTTDNVGSYTLAGLANGLYNVMVDDPSKKRVAQAVASVEAKEGHTAKLPLLRLTPGSLVVGTVTDAETGKPIAGAHVGSYGPHRPKTSAAIVFAATDSLGRYKMRVAGGKNYIYIFVLTSGVFGVGRWC